MRIGIVGAGVAGLVAAYRLSQEGHEVDVYERWPGLGGQGATLDVGDGVLLERYYHHWFTSDRHIVDLWNELELGPIEWQPSSMAFFVDGKSRAFTTPLDLLKFSPLPLLDRIKMGLTVLRLQRAGKPVEAYEHETAHEWIVREMGERPWTKIWGPLLRAKFGSRAQDISMAWLWGKLTMRRRLEGKEARKELLGYPMPNFEPLYVALRDRIEANGGRVMIDRPAARISKDLVITPGAPQSFRRGLDPREFEPEGEGERYDSILATVPNDVFLELLDDDAREALAPGYTDKLQSIEYHTAFVLLLELDRQFSPFYWTNVADPSLPFIGLIEHTNFISPAHYGGRRFLYVSNYLEPHEELLTLGPDELLSHYEAGLRKVNPAFSKEWVKNRWLFREPAGQPIVTVGYPERIPPLETGVPGLLLANTTQIYPEDRGTNYAVRLGEDAARRLRALTPA
ncbi:MAG: NAD(P)/FAD-dependent oxidoreductase [Solirubrobacterales bacterium]|nr:NAD(P)/FAD-dependent oxidoreductase [Solirubrobacterales bacterium]